MKNFKKLAIAVSMAATGFTYSQTSYNWLWAKDAQNNANVFGETIVADASGNSYVGGNFSTGNLVLGATTLTNAGGVDFFVAKYNASGVLQWAKRYGSTGNDYIRSLAINPYNIVMTGDFDSPSLTIGASALNSTNGSMFIAKMGTNGVIAWANNSGNSGSLSNDIKMNSTSDIFITGKVEGTTSNFGGTNYTNQQGCIFLAKYSSAGAFSWVQFTSGGNSSVWSSSYGKSLAIDAVGNIHLLGFFDVPMTFGSLSQLSAGIPGNYEPNICIAKYNSAGTALWSKKISLVAGSASSDLYPNAVVVDASSNVFISGRTTNPNASSSSTVVVDFNSSPVFTRNLVTNYGTFVGKYNSSGTFRDARWAVNTNNTATTFNGSTDVGNKSMVIDGSGYLYLSGISANIPNNNNLSTIAKYDGSQLGSTPNPNYLATSVYSSVGQGISKAQALFIDANGSIYTTGCYINGNVSFSTNNLTNTSSFFVARLGSCALPTAPILGSPTINGICINTSATLTAVSSGNQIRWYNVPTLGTAYNTLSNTFITPLVTSNAGATYYAASLNTCGESSSRLSFAVTIVACNRDARLMTTDKDNLSIENSLDFGFNIYPNPSNGQLNIDFIEGRATSGEIFDYTGKKVLVVEFTDNKASIDLSSFSKGIYFVSVRENGKVNTKKIVIE